MHLSVLEQDGSGGWSIAYEVMGLSTEVAEVELAEVFGGSTQLVVGYANANLVDEYLEVYDYRDVTIYSACKQPYDAYLLGDLTGGGVRSWRWPPPHRSRAGCPCSFLCRTGAP